MQIKGNYCNEYEYARPHLPELFLFDFIDVLFSCEQNTTWLKSFTIYEMFASERNATHKKMHGHVLGHHILEDYVRSLGPKHRHPDAV